MRVNPRAYIFGSGSSVEKDVYQLMRLMKYIRVGLVAMGAIMASRNMAFDLIGMSCGWRKDERCCQFVVVSMVVVDGIDVES
jgi:hypothetical protein